MPDLRLVLCETCNGECRSRPTARHRAIDWNDCELEFCWSCEGTGEKLAEVQPISLDDLEIMVS